LAPKLETAVYRATQAALVNVLQHAQARNVSVLLARTGQELSVIVEDDGVGFDVDAVPAGPVAGRFGLLSMEERVCPFGGRVNVESADIGATQQRLRVIRHSGAGNNATAGGDPCCSAFRCTASSRTSDTSSPS
ncbi:MAG: ATP-binding protein, partial [Candidatus Poribacteria bacterium]